MRIGVDIDGVILDFKGAFIPFINDLYNLDVKDEDITDFCFTASGVVSQKEFSRAFGKFGDAGFWSTLKPYPGAVEALDWFSRKGHEVILITQRSKKHTFLAVQQLAKEGFYPDGSISCRHHMGGWKDLSITGLEIDIMIEDRPENIFRAADLCRIPVVIINHPYNQHLRKELETPPVSELVYRADSLTHAVEIMPRVMHRLRVDEDAYYDKVANAVLDSKSLEKDEYGDWLSGLHSVED